MSELGSTRIRLGRTLSIKHLRFDGFPEGSGFWWLRWIDYGAATTRSRSSYLHLLFSKLPENTQLHGLPVLSADLAACRRPSHRAEAHVGWLPVLRIGLVVQAGMIVGELGAELHCFQFESSVHLERMELLFHADPATVSYRRRDRLMIFEGASAFDIGNRPGLLSPSVYPLTGLSDGRLLTFCARNRDADSPILALPCAEVLRIGYAPHASLARAVVDCGWSRWMSRMFDMEHTGPLRDGSGWQIAPLTKLQVEHLAVAANLAINPLARRRANLIHSELITTRRGVLAALLPFQWEKLSLTVACIHQGAHAAAAQWFGYAIESIQWPPPPHGPPGKIIWIPKGDSRR